MESVVNLEPRVDVAIKALIEKLNEQCGRYIDLGPWLQLFSFGTVQLQKRQLPIGLSFTPRLLIGLTPLF